MSREVIYKSDFISIDFENNEYFIESFLKGMSMNDFNKMVSSFPYIKITNFMAVKNAVLNPPSRRVKFGIKKEKISLEISNDEMRASVILCVSENELRQNKKDLYHSIVEKLVKGGVVFGIKKMEFLDDLKNNVPINVAEGKKPVDGEDSVINLYKMKEVKPKIKSDDKVDHYELNLINRIEEGAWLGERIDPIPGKDGKSVKGKVIPYTPGKVFPLLYDRSTVEEIRETNKTVLRAKITGAVHFEGEKIGVSNHLEIEHDVDFKIGNVDFDGFLTVKGSIEDSFTVVASKDIEILGEYGVGSIKEIFSKKGSVYIKGGIAGKNKAIIKSNKDIYTKYVSDATIICEGCVNIGFYCLNSNIKAREVVLDSSKGSIIGGNIEADIKIVSADIGSQSEIKTHLKVNGFVRDGLKEELEEVLKEIELLRNKIMKLKSSISSFPRNMTDEELNEYNSYNHEYTEVCVELKDFEHKRNIIIECLKTKGEGEVAVSKKIYPNSVISIKDKTKYIKSEEFGLSYYVIDDEWKEV